MGQAGYFAVAACGLLALGLAAWGSTSSKSSSLAG